MIRNRQTWRIFSYYKSWKLRSRNRNFLNIVRRCLKEVPARVRAPWSSVKRIRRTRSRLVARATLIRHYERRRRRWWRSLEEEQRGDVRLPIHQRCARTPYVSYHFMPCKWMYACALVKAYHREATPAFPASYWWRPFLFIVLISETALNLFGSRRRKIKRYQILRFRSDFDFSHSSAYKFYCFFFFPKWRLVRRSASSI